MNGVHATRSQFHYLSGFVAQDDVLLGTMTAREALLFAAQLKLPQTLTLQEQIDQGLLLLKKLGLSHVQDQYIGYTGAAAQNSGLARGLSGGERKRVSVCFEMVSNPKILFLDEPTSGLDSFAAKSVMENLRDLSFYGRTIIATIHQPSAEIFRMFDYLLLLADGQTVYYGPAHLAIPYFKSIGIHPAPNINPADFFLKSIHVPPPEENAMLLQNRLENIEEAKGMRTATHEQVERLIAEYKKSTYYADIQQKLKIDDNDEPIKKKNRKELNLEIKNSKSSLVEVSKGYIAPYHTQFNLLLKRSFINTLREPSLLKSRTIQAFGIAVLAGLIWLRLNYTQAGAQDRVSSLFFIFTSATFGALNGPTFVFPSERAVFFREKSSNMYSTGIYYLSKYLTELPINVILPVISTTILYWMIGFNNSPIPWLILTAFTILLNITGNALGMALSCSILNTGIVIKIQPLIILPLMLFGGFFLNSSSVPNYFIWLEYLSFIRYAFRAGCNAIFTLGDPLTFQCPNNMCPYPNGEAIVKSLDFVGHPIYIDAIILLGMTFGIHLIAFGFLLFHAKRRA